MSELSGQCAKVRTLPMACNDNPKSCAGYSRQFDHTCLVAGIWKHLLKLGCEAHVVRVPTDDNIADLPSRYRAAAALALGLHAYFRECYRLLRTLGAKAVAPTLQEVYLQAQTWEQLSLKFDCSPVGAKDAQGKAE